METIGVVEDYKKERYINDDYWLWYPVIKFEVGDKQVRKKINIGTTKKKYKNGDRITIRYNPNSIDEFYVVEYTICKLSNIFSIVGIIILIIDVILCFLFNVILK